jgi:hypothetical protein
MNIIIERFRKANEDKLLPQNQLAAPELLRTPGQRFAGCVQNKPLIGIPEDLPILTGESVYNLRAALDYLVYELAIKDSGSHKTGTQFIIEDVKSDIKNRNRGFDARAKTYLAGLSNKHIRDIELLQPYNGCAWSKALREISNPDKHRHLVAVNGRWKTTSLAECGVRGSFDNYPDKVIRGSAGSNTDIYFECQYAIDITLPDGTPLMETLDIVKRGVTDTIKAFESEF